MTITADEREKRAIELGLNALKALMTANGGGAIVILTFYGNLLAKGGTDLPIDSRMIEGYDRFGLVARFDGL